MSDENKKIFAKNLNHYLDINNKTQADVANALGFKISTFSSWCTAQKMPRMDKIEKLSRYFGIKKSDLIEEMDSLNKKSEDRLSETLSSANTELIKKTEAEKIPIKEELYMVKDNEKYLKDFSRRFNEALTVRDISAAELSRLSGADESAISNYKKGKYLPKQLRLATFAKILNVSVSWLLGADVPMEPVKTISEHTENKYANINSLLDKLNDKGVQKVESYTEDLVATKLYNKVNEIDFGKMKTADEIMQENALIAKGGGKVNISEENLQKLFEKEER